MSENKKLDVTLADVAERAGVSRMTVSKVLRGTGSISEGTRKRVLDACDVLGYVPNTFASALSSKKSPFIGVIIPSASDFVFSEVLSGVNEIVRPQGLQTLIGETLFDPEIELNLVQMMLSLRPTGLIASSGLARLDKTKALLSNRACPLIQIWDATDTGGDATVGLSHSRAGETIAQHFLERGFRNIAYIGSQLDLDLCAGQRLGGFKSALENAGLGLHQQIGAAMPRTKDTGRVLTEKLLEQCPDVDAIYCLNDAMATGCLSYLYAQNYRIPEDVAVAGFNGTSRDYAIRTELTTQDVDRRAIGRCAATLLVDREALKRPVSLVPDKLVVGTST